LADSDMIKHAAAVPLGAPGRPALLLLLRNCCRRRV
jgi:hypothetical protein